ncbi:MAG: OmpH family outer membrane protein [Saprospiraceae bacterium]|jgi:outer membrane protein|nr:OmpH family outer membrane protein [Saprospiraceae bacterium]MDC3210270.1 OmpH family outer membrane protein [Saprospiraceae bacterium]MDG1434722.1 OmpH family outer membrane protein [Saprospiraceae bacterium]MDG2418365.1 OmpH family outer membrane protein [Saprospiraceae bacterium]
MRKFIKISCFLVMFSMITMSAQAQKFGFIDSDAILIEMPKVKQARANLEVLQKQLQTKGQNMVTDFQTKVAALQDKSQKGLITPKDAADEEKKLLKKQEEIQAFEQDMIRQLQEREQKELQPILNEVNDAIKAVAKENGYQFIFEKKTLLYYEDAMDVGVLVKAKLKM